MLRRTIVIGAGTGLEDVRSLVVVACYQETNAVRSLTISLKKKFLSLKNKFTFQQHLSANLHLIAKIGDHAGHGQGCVVAVSRAETLVPHPS